VQLSRHFREPVNGLLHLSALLASLAGVGLLMAACRADGFKVLAIAIYGIGMAGCFLGSTLHHLIRGERALEMRLLRLDHALIYPFIAGTYTPVCLLMLPARSGGWLLGLVWAIAFTGMVYKLGFARDPATVEEPPNGVDTALYVAMGWLALPFVGQLSAAARPGTLVLAILGGVVYSLGGLILSRKLCDFWPGRFGHHELWHVCVIAGAAAFFAFICVNLT
jgi:hemolysin III